MKTFLKIFGIVVIAEIALGFFASLVLQQSDIVFLRSAGHITMEILSLPLSCIDPTYPYYSMEPGWVILLMMLGTYLFHTIPIFLVYKSVKKPIAK